MTEIKQSWKGPTGWLCGILVVAAIWKIVANIPLEAVIVFGIAGLIGVLFVGRK